MWTLFVCLFLHCRPTWRYGQLIACRPSLLMLTLSVSLYLVCWAIRSSDCKLPINLLTYLLTYTRWRSGTIGSRIGRPLAIKRSRGSQRAWTRNVMWRTVLSNYYLVELIVQPVKSCLRVCVSITLCVRITKITTATCTYAAVLPAERHSTWAAFILTSPRLFTQDLEITFWKIGINLLKTFGKAASKIHTT